MRSSCKIMRPKGANFFHLKISITKIIEFLKIILKAFVLNLLKLLKISNDFSFYF